MDISPVLEELKKIFGRSFLLGVFFPVLIIMCASLALYFEVTEGEGTALAAWESLPVEVKILTLLVGLIVITVIASLLYYFQFMITRLFEGYWPRIWPVSVFRDWRVRLYNRRWNDLETQRKQATPSSNAEAEITEEQILFYPHKNYLEKMMPTRIGNILRASEVYPHNNYEIDAPIIWTRLYPLLPQEVTMPLVSSKTSIDFMLLMAVLSVTFTLIWCPALALLTNRLDLFLLCSLGFPLGWICYQNALQNAVAYSEQLKAIFDLHRFDLLKSLNIPIPSDLDSEREIWKALKDLFYYTLPLPDDLVEPIDPEKWDRVATALAKYIENIKPPTP